MSCNNTLSHHNSSNSSLVETVVSFTPTSTFTPSPTFTPIPKSIEQLISEGNYIEAAALYKNDSTLTDIQKTAIEKFAIVYSAIKLKTTGYTFDVFSNGSAANNAIVYAEHHFKGSNDEIVSNLYNAMEAACYMQPVILTQFKSEYRAKAKSFAQNVSSSYSGPFSEEVHALAQSISPTAASTQASTAAPTARPTAKPTSKSSTTKQTICYNCGRNPATTTVNGTPVYSSCYSEVKALYNAANSLGW